MLSLDSDAGFVTIPGKNGKTMNVDFEDVRIAPKNELFDEIIQAAIDELDDEIADMLEITPVDNKIEQNDRSADCDLSNVNEKSCMIDDQEVDNDDKVNDEILKPSVGDRIQVYWPMDVKYYTGEVKEVLQDGRHVIEYDDSDKETLNLDNENWKFVHSIESNAIELLQVVASCYTSIK